VKRISNRRKKKKIHQDISKTDAEDEARIVELLNFAESGNSSIVMVESQTTELEQYKINQVTN